MIFLIQVQVLLQTYLVHVERYGGKGGAYDCRLGVVNFDIPSTSLILKGLSLLALLKRVCQTFNRKLCAGFFITVTDLVISVSFTFPKIYFNK